MKICITGASGFIGSAIVESLKSSGITPLLLARNRPSVAGDLETEEIDLESLSSFDSRVLNGYDALIHTAARAHIMKDEALDPLVEYRRINCDAVLELAKLAAGAGVGRFVFLSSIKVNGELTKPGKSFVADSYYTPDDPYGLSKYEAEKGLLEIAKNSDMEVVIIRPPLVYGPGVKGNFASMISWIKKGILLPFGAIHNKRSLVALDNLVDFIILCARRDKSPKAANEVFLISDGKDVSTSELLRRVAESYGVKSRLMPVPVSWMRFVAKILGKGDISDRLFGNLQVDSSKARELLGWNPVINMDKQLEKMAEFDKGKSE